MELFVLTLSYFPPVFVFKVPELWEQSESKSEVQHNLQSPRNISDVCLHTG